MVDGEVLQWRLVYICHLPLVCLHRFNSVGLHVVSQLHVFRSTVAEYSFREQADMIFMYGRANGNGCEAARRYEMGFPDRRQQSHPTFVAVYRRVAETGTVAPQTSDRGRSRVFRTLDQVEHILQCVDDDPGMSTRQLAVAYGTSHSTAWRVLHEQLLYPYHIQRVAVHFTCRLSTTGKLFPMVSSTNSQSIVCLVSFAYRRGNVWERWNFKFPQRTRMGRS